MKVIFLLSNIIIMLPILLSNGSAQIRQSFDENPSNLIILLYGKAEPLRSAYDGYSLDARRFKAIEEQKEKRKETELLKFQHAQKMRELINFMQSHILSTNYFYDEMKRIKEQKQVRGALRKMVQWLEQPGHAKQKRKVLQCYVNIRNEQKKKTGGDVWEHKTNNLVINVVKDPHSDGFLN